MGWAIYSSPSYDVYFPRVISSIFERGESIVVIKTVFFDMGGTIETFSYSSEMRLSVTPGLRHLLLSYGIDLQVSDQALYNLIINGLSNYHLWRLDCQDELLASEVWMKYILKDYSQEFPQLEAIAEELMVWIETHYYQRQMRPEIPAVLESIHKMGYKIGLISNVNSKGQVPLNLTQYGIIHYFNPIVLSSEYKRRKPDPSIFHYAARLSNTPASECIYIGDRIARDVLGAKRAGYKYAIQIHHDFKHGENDDGATPDLIIHNMNELVDFLKLVAQREKTNSKPQITPKQVRAVLFDADGVLYYRKEKNKEYEIIRRELNIQSDNVPESKKQYYRHLASIGEISFEEYKQEVLKLYGVTDPIQLSRGIQISQQMSNTVHYFQDTHETLREIKNKNIYLGIVTDTAHPLHEKIDKLERGGFGHLWDTIISSREVGIQKPDAKIFQLALTQLGITPDQAVFVGHSSIELEGAQNVGMKTVAFNYDANAKADYYIKEFSELVELPFIN
jgi:putative hydrolase of the HAD superfamily